MFEGSNKINLIPNILNIFKEKNIFEKLLT